MIKYNYKSSGVDIKKADEIIKNISKKFEINNLSNFAGLFASELLNDYSLFSCCDGIGSKIIPLIEKNRPEIIANDLVAMNLNDLITSGAKPLFFLDYIAANNLEGNIIQETIENLKLILNNYNCSLLGGEISELSCLIKKNFFDIAGFIVGICKKDNILNKNYVKKGDRIIAFTSSGIHSNGFTLIRKLYSDKIMSDDLFEECLKPTKIYADILYKLNDLKLIKSAANITGGGIYSNLIRAINSNFSLKLDYNSIPKQEIFEFLKTKIQTKECYSVFNMGVGFCVICDKKNVQEILKNSAQYNPFVFGEVI